MADPILIENTTGTILNTIYDIYETAQSFQISEDSVNTTIDIRIKREGSDLTLYADLYDANASGEPIGSSLWGTSFSGISTNANGAWHSMTVSRAKLIAGADYALWISYPAGDSTNKISWFVDNGSGVPNCIRNRTDDGGTSWSEPGPPDANFKIRGWPQTCKLNVVSPVSSGDSMSPHLYYFDASSGDKRIACLNDPSDHGGTIITSNADGTCMAGGDIVCVNGATHSCPILGHGVTSITPITTKSKHNSKLIITEGAVAGCGAVIYPPERKVYVVE